MLDSPLILAPMAGYTDAAFRLLAKQHGCGLVTSEMISSHGLIYDNDKTKRYLHSDPREAPLSVQIFGADPLVMARAAEMVQENGAHIVDINMGCPVKRVVKTGAGAALLRDLPRVGRILSEVRRAVTCPLTIKIRSGWSADEITAPDVASLAQDMGVDAVAVHPRTARQGFGGSADWDVIKRLKQRVSIPVIGNGDVREPSDVVRMINHTGCDAVMIGRGCLGKSLDFFSSGRAARTRKNRRSSRPSKTVKRPRNSIFPCLRSIYRLSGPCSKCAARSCYTPRGFHRVPLFGDACRRFVRMKTFFIRFPNIFPF